MSLLGAPGPAAGRVPAPAPPEAERASPWNRPIQLPRPRAGDVAAGLGLVGLAVMVFAKVLFLGRVLYKRDVHLVWHPQVEAFVRAVAAGSWPVWDPFPGFGQPLLADPSAQVLYPFTWFNLVLAPWNAYSLLAVAHVLLSGLGLYALARRWEFAPAPAFVAASVWMLAGPVLSLVDLWHHLAGAAWMPWVVLAADRALVARTLRSALVWGAAMAAQILAGSADMSAMTGLVVIGLAVSRQPSWRGLAGLLPSAAVAAGTALGLSAALWLSAVDVATRSARWSLPAEVRTYWSVHPLALLSALLPALWNVPLRPDLHAALFESREPFLFSIYLGLPALGLVAAAAACSPSPRKKLLVAVSAVAVLVALGRHGPFYEAITFALPPLRILRYPVKALVPLAFAWSLLAGLGFDVWRRASRAPRRRWLIGVVLPVGAMALLALAAAALVFWYPEWVSRRFLAPVEGGSSAPLLAAVAGRLAVSVVLALSVLALAVARLGRFGPRLLAAGVAVLAVGDLLVLHRNLNPAAPRALFTHRPEVLQHLRGEPRPRVYVYDYSVSGTSQRHLGRATGYSLGAAPAGWRLDDASALAMQMYLTPACAGRWDLSGSYEVDYRGLYATPLARTTSLLRSVEGSPAHLRLLQVGGVDHVVTLHQAGFEDLRPAARVGGLFVDPIRVYDVPATLPRTFAVSGVRHAVGPSALELLVDPGFDPRQEVLLEEGPTRPPTPGFHGTSRIVEFRPDRVRLEVDLDAPGYVVLLEGYDPGWRATVGGRPAHVLRANVNHRAVAVPAGRHDIEFEYRPRAVVAGLLVSASSLLAVLAAAWITRRPGSAPPPGPEAA